MGENVVVETPTAEKDLLNDIAQETIAQPQEEVIKFIKV